MNKIPTSFSVVLLIMMTVVSVVIISSPNNPVALTKKINQWAMVGFSIKDEPKPPLAVVVPQLSKPAVKIFADDSNGLHKAMFNLILFTLDSMHAISNDPRADSIYQFIRPRLVFVDSVPTNPIAIADPIFVLPLLDSERKISTTGAWGDTDVANAGACYSENLEHGFKKSITVFDINKVSFAIFAMILYHESEHAYRAVYDQEKDEELEHAEIFILECSLITTCMERDSVLSTAYSSINFDTTVNCSISSSSPYFNNSEGDRLYLMARLHGIWWIKKYGMPGTDKEKLDLYHKVHCTHSVVIEA